MLEQFIISKFYFISAGDQGFLNSYYADFPNAHVFDPNLSSEELKSKPEPELQRLSTLYNADVGLYMLANKVITETIECDTLYFEQG